VRSESDDSGYIVGNEEFGDHRSGLPTIHPLTYESVVVKSSEATVRKLHAALLALWAAALAAAAQNPGAVYPGAAWESGNLEELGWSSKNLEEAHKYFLTLPAASVVVVDRGRVVAHWGDPAKRIKVSSIRKSLLSALYGIYVAKGRIDLNQTLEQLGIDDDPPLTQREKQATVRMLLEARSGVYHSYVAGTPAMRTKMPDRGSHLPGTFWYYNNWDFNALGTIFERQLHTTIGSEFLNRIALPIQMQDFRLEDMYYLRAKDDAQPFERSVYPAYHFRLSARDLARLGYLYLQRGAWNGTQLIPRDWIEESTRPYSDASNGGGYGYLWWVNGFDLPVKSFNADGALGKYLFVIPERGVVVAYLNHTEFPDNASAMSETELRALPTISPEQMSVLLKLLLNAQQQQGPRAAPKNP
jgi:CubicO group peptidase (beta-lactamase class C family)